MNVTLPVSTIENCIVFLRKILEDARSSDVMKIGPVKNPYYIPAGYQWSVTFAKENEFCKTLKLTSARIATLIRENPDLFLGTFITCDRGSVIVRRKYYVHPLSFLEVLKKYKFKNMLEREIAENFWKKETKV